MANVKAARAHCCHDVTAHPFPGRLVIARPVALLVAVARSAMDA
jgi:hypothetical protein